MALLLRHSLGTLAALAGLAFVPASALAAESYDNCTGFIDSLPTTISTQGVWCLKKNLSTDITDGEAITIAANNVTIDCNDFKIGGLSGGDSSIAYGIFASNRQNATVRHCNVRGFYYGIILDGSGGGGHLVEDNRLDNNLYAGIWLRGDNNRVLRNAVYDTGGHPGKDTSYAIVTAGEVIDNTVAGVFAIGASTSVSGISLNGVGSVARNNQVRGLQASGSGIARGIKVFAASSIVDGNQLIAPAGTNGYGISGYGAAGTICSSNAIVGFSAPVDACSLVRDAGGNAIL